MTQNRIPRRPAMLNAQQAESIVGDSDPAHGSELAHMSAWALIGHPHSDFPAQAIVRIRNLVITDGVDTLAELWERSPEFTLPGALWRVYLFAQWLQREPTHVEARYRAAVLEDEHDALALSPETVGSDIRRLLSGQCEVSDIPSVLQGVTGLMRILASGDLMVRDWITQLSDPLAYEVSTRVGALLRTAEELDMAIAYAREGKLD